MTDNLTFGQRAALLKAKRNPLSAAITLDNTPEPTLPIQMGNTMVDFSFGDIVLNDKQSYAAKLAGEGKSFVLTGAAGTGKTTAQAAVVQMLEAKDVFGVHKFKYIGEQPSIAIVAFTKVAVRNIQKALKKNPATKKYSSHCMTIHTLLEFQPEEVERFDKEGNPVVVKMFMPQRTSSNPLTITHLIIEEASMVGLDLWKQLYDALLPGVQIIYLGDINQLPPVFGKSVMSYALCKLPVVELTHVYRQALDNPIIANAHRILAGEMIEQSEDGRFTIVSGTSTYKVGQERMAIALTQMLNKLHDIGDYNEHSDIILIPFNKQPMGTKSMNEKIASFLGQKRNALVQEVKAGFNKWWLAVGDKVLVEKQTCWITSIVENPKYMGESCAPPALYSRDGTLISGGDIDFDEVVDMELADYSDFSMEDIEEDMGKRAASHIVTVSTQNPNEPIDTEDESAEAPLTMSLSSAGDFRDETFSFGYCMSVHKAQGSEWRKVFILLHYDFSAMLNRELMYTAVTRAREEVVICAKPDLIEVSIKRQKIAGVGLQEKILYFNGGALSDLDAIPVTKSTQDIEEELRNQLLRNAEAHRSVQGIENESTIC